MPFTNCLMCNKNIQVSNFVLKRGRRYCSKSCYGKSRYLNLPELTKYQNDVVTGILLGDASINKTKNPNKNSNLRIKQKRVSYLEDLKNVLGLHVASIDPVKSKKITNVEFANGKRKILHSDKEYLNYHQLRTSNSAVWTKLRSKWYLNGIKKVPVDIDLNPVILSHWFMNDGSNNLKQKQLYFATDAFEKDCIQLLQEKLSNLNLKNFINFHYSKPRIHISKKSYFDFIEMISPFVSQCFFYKVNR